MAMIFATVGGVTLGMVSAIRRNSPADVGTMIFANLGVSIPVFVLGLLLAFVFAVLLKGTPFALPPSGRLSPGVSVEPLAVAWGLQDLEGIPRVLLDFVSNIYLFNTLVTVQIPTFVDAFRHLILPAIAVGTIPLAIIARMTRSSLLEVLGLDFVRTARAKGLTERAVIYRHGMRNAMLPVITVVGLSLGAFLSGADPDRDHLQPDRHGQDAVRGHRGPRLHRDPGRDHRGCRGLPGRQPRRGRVVRRP